MQGGTNDRDQEPDGHGHCPRPRGLFAWRAAALEVREAGGSRCAGGLDRTYSPDRTGGAEGNRTPDLLNAIQALSQLSYGPVHRRRRDLALFSGVIKQEYASLCQIIAVSRPCPQPPLAKPVFGTHEASPVRTVQTFDPGVA
jgi:hypothetical protein